MKTIKIFQFPIETMDGRICTFRQLPDDITIKEIYEKTKCVWYEETIHTMPDLELCEKLFHVFNTQHPDTYKGRSMSVSDAVEINDKMYVCDSIGFREIHKELKE